MPNTYAQFSTKATPQSVKARPDQVKNNAGGYVFQITPESRFMRFLTLGSEGGSYYVKEQELTRENATAAIEYIKINGKKAVDTIVQVSDAGRAPKNDPAIFLLALCCSPDVADAETRAYAFSKLDQVCRIPTHLFHFLTYAQNVRGWGRGLREAVANWYLSKKPDQLGYQIMKYQQRDGWSHRDALRLAHPKAPSDDYNKIFKYITTKEVTDGLPRIILAATDALKDETSAKEAIGLIREYGLSHEMINNKVKNDPDVWAALLDKMPITASIRNLGKMTNVGLLFSSSCDAAKLLVKRITDKDILKRGRVHPISILSALKTYEQGHGERGSLEWEPVRSIVDALDEAFYLAFDTIEPTGKSICLALDISGSMGASAPGIIGLTCRDVCAAMAMVTARTEKDWTVVGFTSGGGGSWRNNAAITELKISPRQRLDDVVREVQKQNFGGTDCALPILWAIEKKLKFDAFCTYTDSETWANPDCHPFQALKQYRAKTGIEAKNIVVGIEANDFSIADPQDPNSLDVVGFDANAPTVMADFIAGRI